LAISEKLASGGVWASGFAASALNVAAIAAKTQTAANHEFR
jgi:hypothetical protein